MMGDDETRFFDPVAHNLDLNNITMFSLAKQFTKPSVINVSDPLYSSLPSKYQVKKTPTREADWVGSPFD
jgi:hypothetical protein